jgi:hypothetical protein
MPDIVRYFEKVDHGRYVEVVREYDANRDCKAVRYGRKFRLANDGEGGEVAFVPDMHTPIHLLPI